MQPVWCIKMGNIGGNCKNNGRVAFQIGIRKRIPAQLLYFSLSVNASVSGVFLITLPKV